VRTLAYTEQFTGLLQHAPVKARAQHGDNVALYLLPWQSADSTVSTHTTAVLIYLNFTRSTARYKLHACAVVDLLTRTLSPYELPLLLFQSSVLLLCTEQSGENLSSTGRLYQTPRLLDMTTSKAIASLSLRRIFCSSQISNAFVQQRID
jgi:hypothetical protein